MPSCPSSSRPSSGLVALSLNRQQGRQQQGRRPRPPRCPSRSISPAPLAYPTLCLACAYSYPLPAPAYSAPITTLCPYLPCVSNLWPAGTTPPRLTPSCTSAARRRWVPASTAAGAAAQGRCWMLLLVLLAVVMRCTAAECRGTQSRAAPANCLNYVCDSTTISHLPLLPLALPRPAPGLPCRRLARARRISRRSRSRQPMRTCT
jgi:hypothetical protein